jgi:allantoinase
LSQGKPNTKTRQRAQAACPNFLYSCDAYDDELPRFTSATESPAHKLVVPYTLSENDMCFVRSANFSNGREFSAYLIDHLQMLLDEARSGATTGKMMSVGLHCRIAGRAGRAKGLKDFLEFATKQDDVWICRRDEIAKHWYDNFWEDEWGSKPEVPIHGAIAR